MKKPLRIGLLVEGTTLPRFLFRPLERLVAEGHVEVVLVLRRPTPRRSHEPKRRKLVRALNERLYRLLSPTRGAEPREAFAPLLAQGATQIAASVVETRYSDRLDDATLKAARTVPVDFLIRDGFGILRGGVLSLARGGVLSFHHGDNRVHRGGPALYWEFSEGRECTGVVLQRLTDELDGGVVVARGWADVVGWDYNRTRRRIVAVGEALLYDFLRRGGPSVPPERGVGALYDGPLHRSPSNRRALGHTLGFAWRMARKTFAKALTVPRWSIYLGPKDTPLHRLFRLDPPRGEFWADPSLVRHGGALHLFFERFDYRTATGRIGWARLDDRLRVAETGDADLGLDVHASFPSTFVEEGTAYMVPEAGATNAVRLYRAEAFPRVWRPVATLVPDVRAADSAVIRHEGHWYLFTTYGTFDATTGDLEFHLHHAPELVRDGWTHHPASPVCIDIRRARLAGRPFVMDGTLIRPAQDGSARYGRRIALYEITTLTPHAYEERFLRTIEPRWGRGLNRTHGIALDDDVVALDAARTVWRWRS